jgi:5'-3' exonuclease
MTDIIVAKTHPIILIDNSYYIFNRYFATVRWFKQREEDFEINHENIIQNKEFIIAFIKHFEADIKKLTKKFKTIKENIIFCIDCPRSTIWRNIIYDKYKQSRIKKDNFNSDIFDLFENYLNTNKFKTCKYENLEADDIVYLLQKQLNNINEIKIFIITNDGDYLQMYSNNVKIFNMQLKDLSLKINYNPKTELLLKIIIGDKSDNIPKIQAGMRKDNALKIALMNEDDRIKYMISHNILDTYNLNKKLIDLNEIPETIVKNFYEYYNISIQ